MDGKGPMKKTWVLKKETLSFKPVKTLIAWSSSLYSWAVLRAAHQHLWIQVHIGKGKCETISFQIPLSSRKYSIIVLEFYSRLLICDRRVEILTRSTFENLTYKLFHTSSVVSWKTIVEAIWSETELVVNECIRW